MSTTTLTANINEVSSLYGDYVAVLFNTYWPFVVGAIILVVAWKFGKKVLFGLG